jgi:hypothetical protein
MAPSRPLPMGNAVFQFIAGLSSQMASGSAGKGVVAARSPQIKMPSETIMDLSRLLRIKNWDYVVDKQSGFDPQMTRIIADFFKEICVHRRNLRMEMLFYLSGA